MNEVLLSADQMRRAETFASANLPALALMERAGKCVADAAVAMLGGVPGKTLAGKTIAVVCGPGNNGGDGFIAARLLRGLGAEVRVGMCGDLLALKGDAAEAAKRCGGRVDAVERLDLADCDLTIDALFGTGLSRDLAGEALALVMRINEWRSANRKPVLAVDVPSGLDGDTGRPRPVCVQADATVTFFRFRPGHFLLPGRAFCGRFILADIGIPEEALKMTDADTFANGPPVWAPKFPFPGERSHKFARGHALVVAGGLRRGGAARLSARGALRIGAGLVTLATPSNALAVNAAHLTAIMLAACDDARGLDALLEDRRINAVVLGPGGGIGEAMRENVARAFTAPVAPAHFEPTRAVVLDADALTSFSGALAPLTGWIKAHKGPCVMTPHDGEFARLFGEEKRIFQRVSKLDRARAAAEFTGATIVMKGADTVVASPDGRASIGRDLPPWLATAGSGDVLAGFIAGLLAQGMPAFEAASAAVWLHGACARAFGPGLIAEDLPEALPGVLKGLFPPPADPPHP